MTLQDRDRRALVMLGVALLLILGFTYFSGDSAAPAVVGAVDSIPAAEKRLAPLRDVAALVPGKDEAVRKVRAELDAREKGIIQAETAAQAQAQLLQIIRRVARAQNPPVDIRNTEIGQVKPYADAYGEVAVAVSLDMRIGTAHPKQKNMPVRMTISGLVRRDLIPDKKGAL